jgi:hypothetical protein
MRSFDYIRLLDPVVLAKYLSKMGWVKVDVNSVDFDQFLSPNQIGAIIVPYNSSFVDYEDVLSSALKQTAICNEISLPALLNKLLSPPSDILKWRIDNKQTSNGLLPFESVSDIFESIKSLIGTSAKDVLSPELYHKKVFTRDITDFLASCRLGQTERGSYIFNVLCPLGDTQLELYEDPLSRRVNINILNTINQIQSDILTNNKNRVEDSVGEGCYSVNFLESIIAINEATIESGIEIKVDWCNDLYVSPEMPNVVVIDPVTIDDIGDIVERLKPVEETKEQRFFGKISSIEAHPNIDSRESVKIKIATIDENEKKINVNIDLDYSYFSEVDRAFENGLTVNVKGTLTSHPKKKSLEASSFEVIDD